jgi:hypothetical protein
MRSIFPRCRPPGPWAALAAVILGSALTADARAELPPPAYLPGSPPPANTGDSTPTPTPVINAVTSPPGGVLSQPQGLVDGGTTKFTPQVGEQPDPGPGPGPDPDPDPGPGPNPGEQPIPEIDPGSLLGALTLLLGGLLIMTDPLRRRQSA